MLLGIRQRRIDFLGVAVLIDGPYRAVRRALPALDAGRFVEGYVRRRRDARVFTAPDKLQRPHSLHLLANRHTASAQDAFFRVENQRAGCVILRQIAQPFAIRRLADAELSRQPLQLAIIVARALQAIVRMGGQNQLDHGTPNGIQLGVVGGDVLALCDRCHARAHQLIEALHLHHANTASRPSRQVGVVAHARNFHVHMPGRI